MKKRIMTFGPGIAKTIDDHYIAEHYFILEGNRYELPMSYEQLMACGWSFTDPTVAAKLLYPGDSEFLNI